MPASRGAVKLTGGEAGAEDRPLDVAGQGAVAPAAGDGDEVPRLG